MKYVYVLLSRPDYNLLIAIRPVGDDCVNLNCSCFHYQTAVIAIAVVVCFSFFFFSFFLFVTTGATKEISLVTHWLCLFALHYTLVGQLVVPELHKLEHLHTELLKNKEEFFVVPFR